MVNLDDPQVYETIDLAHMHERLASQSHQLRAALSLAMAFRLPDGYRQCRQILIAGMGGSALAGALIQGACSTVARAPIHIWRDYGLPGYAIGPETLVIASSHSGETEETLSAFEEAVRRGCRCIAFCTGGRLAQRAREAGAPVFQYSFAYTPREGIAWLSIPMLVILSSLGTVPDPVSDVEETATLLDEMSRTIGIASPAMRNPAKRLAGQFMDRLPIVYGAGILAPVAQRWKTVLNENAKMLAACEEMPELNHNSIVGYEQPDTVWNKSIVIQLRCENDDPRVSRRFNLTTQLMLNAGINQDTVHARGHSALAQVFSLVYFGDWVSYYAAIIGSIDPTPTDAIRWLKQELNR